jgi:hypothetical protein
VGGNELPKVGLGKTREGSWSWFGECRHLDLRVSAALTSAAVLVVWFGLIVLLEYHKW